MLLVVEGVYNAVFFPLMVASTRSFCTYFLSAMCKRCPQCTATFKDTHADVRADKLYSIYIHRHTICDVYIYIYLYIHNINVHIYIYMYMPTKKVNLVYRLHG